MPHFKWEVNMKKELKMNDNIVFQTHRTRRRIIVILGRAGVIGFLDKIANWLERKLTFTK